MRWHRWTGCGLSRTRIDSNDGNCCGGILPHVRVQSRQCRSSRLAGVGRGRVICQKLLSSYCGFSWAILYSAKFLAISLMLPSVIDFHLRSTHRACILLTDLTLRSGLLRNWVDSRLTPLLARIQVSFFKNFLFRLIYNSVTKMHLMLLGITAAVAEQWEI